MSSSTPIVLITGITGFLASHVLHDILESPANFHVRGTLRSFAKKQAVLDKLKPEHRGRVEFVEVKDTATSDLTEAVKGVTHIAHVASPYQLNVEDAERDLLKPAIEGTLNILRYAHKEPSVKRIAITSSFAAVTSFKLGGPNRPGFTYTAEDWNPTTYEEAVAFGGAGAFAYSASKKLAEKAAWQFLEDEKPSFEIGTFCPPMIYGPTLQPGAKKSNLNTSSMTIYNLINHAKQMPEDRLPLFCDARDVAAAHTAYLTAANPGNTRFLLCSPDAYNWGTAVAYIARHYPQLKERLPQGWEEGAKSAKDPKTSYAKLDTSPAQDKLGITFRGFEETMRDSIDSLLELEKEPGFEEAALPMTLPEYARYGRQMILPGMSLEGQLKLRRAKVLVVGAGGLGCPATQYLAAAGVGHITVIDGDVVETSNLARQILHTDARVGMSKSRSIREAVKSINPLVNVQALFEPLTTSNALSLIASHDVTLDCTDNALTRYLISDAAALSSRQVVSGAAQGYEGQLMVLHRLLPSGGARGGERRGKEQEEREQEKERGPCYRCLFPKAPRPQDVTDCEDGGVLGTVTGLVGTLQAMETIKLITGLGEVGPPNLLLVSPLSYPPFRTVKLRPRRLATCRACGDPTQVGAESIIRDLESEDYVAFCGLEESKRGDSIEEEEAQRVGVESLLRRSRGGNGQTTILDVRPETEFKIASIPGSLNVPFPMIRRDPLSILSQLAEILPAAGSHSSLPTPAPREITIVCRRGNDSLLAARLLNEAQSEAAKTTTANDPHGSTHLFIFKDVKGGLRALSEIDESFPLY